MRGKEPQDRVNVVEECDTYCMISLLIVYQELLISLMACVDLWLSRMNLIIWVGADEAAQLKLQSKYL